MRKKEMASVIAVNDDKSLLSELKVAICDRGFNAICTSSSDTTLEIIEQNDDVFAIITDTDLSDGPGLQLIQRINSLLPARQISSIVVSEQRSLDIAVRAMRLGVTDFILRPVDLITLSEAIERAFFKTQKVRRLEDFIDDHVEQLRLLVELRNDRRALLPDIPGGETAWDMLVELAFAQAVGRPMTVLALCSGTDTSTATALRRIEALERLGLVSRVADSQDRRRVWVSLTSTGHAAVSRVCGRLSQGLRSLL